MKTNALKESQNTMTKEPPKSQTFSRHRSNLKRLLFDIFFFFFLGLLFVAFDLL